MSLAGVFTHFCLSRVCLSCAFLFWLPFCLCFGFLWSRFARVGVRCSHPFVFVFWLAAYVQELADKQARRDALLKERQQAAADVTTTIQKAHDALVESRRKDLEVLEQKKKQVRPCRFGLFLTSHTFTFTFTFTLLCVFPVAGHCGVEGAACTVVQS